eukprot:comp21779_c2_seq1/m.30923 comp21779_c2_seq1/g.30923  ORF comp21779_c2_seq1/g.30923 comp21779_c2_seq1/m.30923 type:complete len:302 (-) comp21779_c2_seq1:373-1278(-)
MAGCESERSRGTSPTPRAHPSSSDGSTLQADELIEQILQADSYYDILKIDKESCTTDLVRNQYIKMSRLIHPDKHGDNPQATLAFQKLANAYETLRHPHSKRVYDLQGQGMAINPDDALSDLIKHIYKEFYEGEFATLLEFVDRINAEHPELHIERGLVEQVLLDTRKLIEDVDKVLADVQGDLSSAGEAYQRMQHLRYLNLIGRAACLAHIVQVLVFLPLRVVKVPIPGFVVGAWDRLWVLVEAASGLVTYLPEQALGMAARYRQQLWVCAVHTVSSVGQYIPWLPFAQSWPFSPPATAN